MWNMDKDEREKKGRQHTQWGEVKFKILFTTL
jgi:hypothetical protein